MDGELAWAYVRQGSTATWKHPGTLQNQQPSRLNPPRPGDAGVGRALLETTRCRPGLDGVTQKREAQAMMRLGGLQARPPADRPRQLPGPGPPPSPLLHVWDSDCLPEQFMVSARTPGDSLPTVPWPQFYCPSCPLSHQPPHPTPSWPRNPAGAELRPAARSEPFTAAMVRLSPEAAPGSPPGLCVHCRPAASQSTPWCWPIPKRQRLLALLSEHEWTRVLGLACCTHMPTQHTCTHADTHTSSHSRVHAHTCTPTHRETHMQACARAQLAWPVLGECRPGCLRSKPVST